MVDRLAKQHPKTQVDNRGGKIINILPKISTKREILEGIGEEVVDWFIKVSSKFDNNDRGRREIRKRFIKGFTKYNFCDSEREIEVVESRDRGGASFIQGWSSSFQNCSTQNIALISTKLMGVCFTINLIMGKWVKSILLFVTG